MDIAGYAFIGLVGFALVVGIIGGLAKALFGFVGTIASIGLSAVLTPTVCQMQLVQNLIEDTPIKIGDTEIAFLRTLIVFLILALVFILICLIIKDLLNWIFTRVKLLKLIDRLLGAILAIAVVWVAFGALVGIASVGTDWATALAQQITDLTTQIGFPITIDLVNILNSVFDFLTDSQILQAIYGEFNPIGELIVNMF